METNATLRGKSAGGGCAPSIISRQGRETFRSSRARTKGIQQCENNEPRPRETTGVLMLGWPPKGRLPYKVKLASHERAAIVQRLAESWWLPNRSFFCGVSVATKAVGWRSSSASPVTADSSTAVKRVPLKPVYESVANTTVSISKVSTDGGTMRTGNGLIAGARRAKK